jgi:hypothetical protein
VIHVGPALSVPLSEPVLARIMPVGPDERVRFGRGEGDLRREP